MKIDSTLKPTASGTLAPSPKPAAPRAPGSSAEVRLSEAAAQLSASDDSAPIDRARVEEIKAAITEGRFKINAGAIADGLIAASRELIDGQRKG
ncbi:MAG: flagellar biosynthesis anti-sigma factor FlgM [Betaproteobacteria bacterium]